MMSGRGTLEDVGKIKFNEKSPEARTVLAVEQQNKQQNKQQLQPATLSTKLEPKGMRGTSIPTSVGGRFTETKVNLAGTGHKEPLLPGDMLKKKLIQKMVRERKMKALGDRVKTTPINAGMNGGSLVIPGKGRNGSAGGQSASKTLPSMKGYKLNPKPLVGGGKSQKGGFIFATIAAIIAAVSAAASSAAAVAVAGTTVGALATAAATGVVSGAAAAAGGLIVKKIAGDGIKDVVNKAIKKTSITLSDFSTKDKLKLRVAHQKFRNNPTKAGLIALGVKIAPMARDIMKKKLAKSINVGMKGQGLKLAGSGQAKKFDVAFVKSFVKKVQ